MKEMTMSETTPKEFKPITTQEQLDTIIKNRLVREREKWQKESGTEELQTQLEAKHQEIADLKREHDLENTRRAVHAELDQRGVDAGRREHIMKLVDLGAIEVRPGGEPDREHILTQIDGVAKDLPELVRPRGAGSGGSKRPILDLPEKPLTREEVESMSPEEQTKPGMRERIDRFLAGERE
jgi:hypothetical protein